MYQKLSQNSPPTVSPRIKTHIKKPKNTLYVLSLEEMYDITTFLDLYLSNSYSDFLSGLWVKALILDDKIFSFEPVWDESKSKSTSLLFILLVSISFSVVVPFNGPSIFAKSKTEDWISWYDPSIIILP